MNLAAIIGELLSGWLLADLVTAAFHWWEDTHQHLVNWPIIGPYIIAPNILHHENPLAFTERTFLYRNGASIVAAALIGAALVALFGPSPWMLSLVVGGALSNEVHRYAHQPSAAPAWYSTLQQVGIVQSAKEHAAHHRPPFDRNYCILTDWLNPFIQAVRQAFA